MIKFNVIIDNIKWYHFIKSPAKYINKRIIRLNAKNKIFSKNKIYCTLLLSGSKEIKLLNKKFRKKNKTTDILSFPFQTKTDLKNKLKKGSEIYLGDIIINLDKVKNKNNLTFFKKEFDKLWLHGLVHLFGYVHKSDRDFKLMQQVEKKYINFIN